MPNDKTKKTSTDANQIERALASKQTLRSLTRTLDTGTGGFPIGDKNDLYTYDVGIEDANGSKGTWSRGDINVDKETRDLSEGTIKTLASYMSDVTLGKAGLPVAPNAFPIANPWGEEDPKQIIVSTTTNEGRPSPLAPSSNMSRFARDIMPGDSRSQRVEVLRGRQADPSAKMDGNRLLQSSAVPVTHLAPGINTTKLVDGHPVDKYTSAILNNRFSSDLKYSDYTIADRDHPQFAVKYPLGRSLEPESGERVSFGRLAQVGAVLSIRAGLERNSESTVNPSDGGTELFATLPGPAQLGIKRIDQEFLTAKNVLETLTEFGIDDGQLIDPMANSWGTLNNVLDQFSGISNFGMQLLAVALIAAVAVIVGVITSFLPFPIHKLSPSSKDSQGRYPLGSSVLEETQSGQPTIFAILSGKINFWKMIGITDTVYPFKAALALGALEFFGIEANPISVVMSSPSDIIKKSVNAAAENPGYDAIMARSVIRSFLTISDSIKGLVTAFSSNIVSGIKQLFNLIDVFKNSKLIKALNIFVYLGETALFRLDPKHTKTTDETVVGTYDKLSKWSLTDSKENGPDSAGIKGRLKEAGLKTAWSAYRSPDFLMLTNAMYNSILLGKALGSPSMFPTEKIDNNTGIRYGGIYKEPSLQGRIDTEFREAAENALEAEYLPFYFHDVRTNEIVSFHAFLASLSDDYTASYDTSEGFGRVEPVRVYKGTQRKIGLSFYIAALSDNDFDSMWLKINKLTTLLYPQFTEGKTIISSDGKFQIQAPFSQTIGASPMIRLRVGDLIQSNYSKFNLAKLFGYGSAGSVFDGTSSEGFIELANVNVPDVYMRKRDNAYNDTSGKYLFTTTDKLTNNITNNDDIPYSNFTLPAALALKIKEVKDNGETRCVVVALDGANLKQNLSVTSTSKSDFNIDENNRYTNVNECITISYSQIIGKIYDVPTAQLKLTNASIDKILSEVLEDKKAAGDYQASVDKYMNDEKEGNGNAVAKSFRSAGGKGLAGFIETMSFDWYEKTVWSGFGEQERFLGKRAPKMCKVTISFAPIHDITPGLDHTGMNRAPIYPVGPLVPRLK